jgi:hypothetical protein
VLFWLRQVSSLKEVYDETYARAQKQAAALDILRWGRVVPARMWAESRRRCGPSPGADVGRVPARMWLCRAEVQIASDKLEDEYQRLIKARSPAAEYPEYLHPLNSPVGQCRAHLRSTSAHGASAHTRAS